MQHTSDLRYTFFYMKQLLQNIRDGKTIIENIPIPTPREGQALVKVSASLVLESFARMGDTETKRAAQLSESLRAAAAAKTPAK